MSPLKPALRRAATAATLCAATAGLAVVGASSASAQTVTTWTASAPIPVGTYPGHIAVDAVHRLAYVTSNDDTGTAVTVIDPGTNEVVNTINTATAYPYDLAVDPSSQLIYATTYGNSISVTTSGGVTKPAITVDGASALNTMSLDAADQTLYVSGSAGSGGFGGGSSVLYAVDLSDGSSKQVATLGYSMLGGSTALAVDTAAQTAYTGTGRNTVAHLADNSLASTPSLGNQIALDPSRHALWTANYNGSASLIDTQTDKLVVTLPLGGAPAGIAVDRGAGLVYVANSSYNSVSVIDEDTRAVVATVPVDAGPSALAVDANTQDVYVVNAGADTVSVIHQGTADNSRPQAIHFTSTVPAHAYVQATYTATAVGGGSGNRVHFSTDPRSYGVCNVSLRGTVVFAKTGTCVVDADQDGSGAWTDAPTATQTITVVLRPQTVTFPKLTSLRVGTRQALDATSSAKLPITYTVGTPKTCSVSGRIVLAKAVGTCRVDAHAAATAVYAKAAVTSASFTVKR